jgi:hypothetical protein
MARMYVRFAMSIKGRNEAVQGSLIFKLKKAATFHRYFFTEINLFTCLQAPNGSPRLQVTSKLYIIIVMGDFDTRYKVTFLLKLNFEAVLLHPLRGVCDK